MTEPTKIVQIVDEMLGGGGPNNDGNVAHHGPPILTQREAKICAAVVEWIRTARIAYGPHWLPTHVDIEKSRLFWRLRSGKQPLPHRPPTAYSCPWYEVIEEPDRAHWAYEAWFTDDVEGWEPDFKNKCSVCQCLYDIESRNGDDATLRFGPWRFKLYKGPGPDYTAQRFNTTTRQMEKCEPIQGWWIQLIPNDGK